MVNHKPKRKWRENSLVDGVVTAAYGAGEDYVRTFIRSFRDVNDRAKLIMLVTDKRKLARIAKEFNVELHQNQFPGNLVPTFRLESDGQPTRLTELLVRKNPLFPKLSYILPDYILQLLVPLPVARLFHSLRVLRQHRFRYVLVSDCRDVFFQSDPFECHREFELALEPTYLGSCPYNSKWIRDGFGVETYQRFLGRQCYCSGTLFGTGLRVQSHLMRMCKQVRSLRTWRHFGMDQGIHNYLVHNKEIDGEYTESSAESGIIATLGPNPSIRVANGYVVDINNSPFPIVHQYDRLSSVEQRQLKVLN